LIPLAFPAYVRRSDSHWVARPLLAPIAEGVGRDPAVAVDSLETGLRKAYEKVRPSDEQALLWLSWEPPDLETPRIPLQIGYGKRFVECALLVGTFRLGKQRYVTIPRLDRWFVLDGESKLWHGQLQEQVDAHLRDLRAEGAEWEPPAEAELRRDRVLPARIRLHPDIPPIKLGFGSFEDWAATLDDLFKNMTATTALRDLAEDLGERRDLLRALVPDPRVQTVIDCVSSLPPTPLALVGPSGSGRTTLVHEALHQMTAAAEKARRDELLRALQTGEGLPTRETGPPRFYRLDPQRIVTGMSVVGQWQRRLELALGWVRDRRQMQERQPGGDVIFVDDPVPLARVGRARGSDMVASTVLRSWLEQGAFPMVIEATPEQWHRLTELDRAFADLFRVVRVEPPPPERVLAVVTQHRAVLEEKHRMVFSVGAIERAIELEARYGGSRVLPGGLVDRLEQVAQAHAGKDEPARVSHVEDTFRAATGLHADVTQPHQPLHDAQLRARIAAALVGQPAAVDALASAVHAFKSGLRPQGRPVACWLFVGPTGVGKTEAAKVLTKTLFTSDAHLVRLDMNTFADPGAVTRLLGEPGGGEGLLCGAIRQRPYAVLLLDEIEKAHPLVHDLLLQLLDEGRLTDADGRTTSFRTTVVVMTSNVGATEIARGMGFDRGAEALERLYRSAVQKAFRPELVNRLDRIVAFRGLGREELRHVAQIQMHRLLARDGFRNRTVLLDVSPDTLDRVAHDAWDPRFGARGLKRALERRVVAAAATEIAAIRPDQPVRMSVAASEAGLSFVVEPLRWAEAAPVARASVPALAPLDEIDAIEAALEPLRPPDAVVARSPRTPEDADHEEVLSLLDTLRQLRAAAHTEASSSPSGVTEAVRRAVPAGIEPRKRIWSPPGRIFMEQKRMAAGLRSVLLDLAEPAGVAPEDLSEKIGLARLRASALLEGRPRSVRMRLRPASPADPGFFYVADWLWDGWKKLAAKLDGEIVGKGHDRVAHGAGLCDLLLLEAGLHWWLPADRGPIVAELQVDSEPDAPLRRHDVILRVQVPPASPRGPRALHDLRSGEVVSLDDRDEVLPRWLLGAWEAARARPIEEPA
jgi:ATP-dependent Clp protease ATP-binding subunit ClpC